MGNAVGMRSGLGQGADRASGVTRRVVRLVVLLGAAVAAYLVLSLFDREARADAGPIGEPIDQVAATDPVATVKALPHPKPVIPKPAIPKSAIPKSAIPQSVIPQSAAPKAPRIRGGETQARIAFVCDKPQRSRCAVLRKRPELEALPLRSLPRLHHAHAQLARVVHRHDHARHGIGSGEHGNKVGLGLARGRSPEERDDQHRG